jgi:ABC-2 type transport system ATP-binding protein
VSAPAIFCESLVKRYGDKVALAGLDLSVPAGVCLGLLGPNGAGKTTTVEILEGLKAPTSGRVELFGLGWGKGNDRALRGRFGVQLQDTQLADKLRVEEVLTLFRSFYAKGRSIDASIRLLGLEEERRQLYHTLSGGQRQRVALACALIGAPELLFLDEPTTGLDPRARKTLWQVIEGFRNEGGTVLLTTHYMEEAAVLCDEVAIIDQGKLITSGTPASLVSALGDVQFVEFELEGALDEAPLSVLPVVVSAERRGQRHRLCIRRSLAALTTVLAELERQRATPLGLSTHQATLDDVFLYLTGRELENGRG